MKNIINNSNKVKLFKTISLCLAIFVVLLISLSLLNTDELNKQNTNMTITDKVNKFIKHSNNSLQIHAASLQGVSKGDLNYKLFAKQVEKISNDDILLTAVDGYYEIKGGAIKIIAPSAIYSNLKSEFYFDDVANIAIDNATVNGSHLVINTKNNTIWSDDPVIVKIGNSKITSNKFNIQKHGEILNFEDRVTSEINLNEFNNK